MVIDRSYPFDLMFFRPNSRFAARTDPQLGKNMAGIIPHRLIGQFKFSGDTFIIPASGQECQNLVLLFGQGNSFPRRLNQLLQDWPAKPGFSLHHFINRLNYGFGRLIFQNVAGYPGLDQAADIFLVIVGGQDQDFYGWTMLFEINNGLDGGGAGHMEIEEKNVGAQFQAELLVDEVSLLMGADEPALVVGDRVVWRVPAWLGLPHTGRVGVVGTVDVDVTTGEMTNSPACKADLERRGEELAARQPPFQPKKVPETYRAKGVPPAPVLSIQEDGSLLPTPSTPE